MREKTAAVGIMAGLGLLAGAPGAATAAEIPRDVKGEAVTATQRAVFALG